ncbi:YDL057W [Saccharomyces arboricola H-6]|uniref:YDL057W n=1 Tax=Saccharomyces arboricola (strain H-6 / AS 2.3317 / CBS 10644) TaxID=1160507 RepID=J8Q3X9_SACAR|nr:YDL057W [Saccharomyces arboricola H-6]
MERKSVGVQIQDSPPTYINLDQNEKFVYITSKTNNVLYKIAAIVSYPEKRDPSSVNLEDGKLPCEDNKLALLLHGSQSHKNAIYQALLAKRLSQYGYWVLRIDFRGQGDSSDNYNSVIGRTLDQDLEDMSAVYQTIIDTSLREQLYKTGTISLDVIVSHSRGSLAMFEFCLRLLSSASPLPSHLINCAGRYDGRGLLERCTRLHPKWEEEGGFLVTGPRYGEYKDFWIPSSETYSISNVCVPKFAAIPKSCSVMSCYGSCDHIVPLSAASQYAELFKGRHSLKLIENSDHNFYGIEDDPNKLNLPRRRGRVNYSPLVVDFIMEYLINT